MKTENQFIHSTYVKDLLPNGQDGLFIKVNEVNEDGTHTPKLLLERAPKRPVYITKKGLRTHPLKRETEEEKNLDRYVFNEKRLSDEVFKVLNGYLPKGYMSPRKVYASPYVYGADVSAESFYHADMDARFKASGLTPKEITSGVFDTETDMTSEENFNKLIMGTITHETHVYTSVLRSSFFDIDEDGNKKPGDVNKLKQMIKDILVPEKIFVGKAAQKQVKARPEFTYEVHIADSRIDVLKYLLGKMHEHKTDFVSAWNLPFDMQIILETCKDAGVDPEDLLCPPDLPKELRSCNFKVDKGREGDVPSRRWHWLYAPAYTQWYDSMCLYSILRIVNGLEVSYSLDYILRKNEISDGKLKFKDQIPTSDTMSGIDWHRYMQTHHPYEYIIYNIFDSLSVQVMNWVTNDVQALHTLSGITPLQNFNKQTRRGADRLFFAYREMGHILASPGDGENIVEMGKYGGAVLTPERTFKIGLKHAIVEDPELETNIIPGISDIDLSAIYPNALFCCNVSKDTKQFTVVGTMENDDELQTRRMMSLFADIPANAVFLGTDYLGLPGYNQMLQKLNEKIPK